MIIIDVLLVAVIYVLARTVLYLKHKLALAIIDRDAAQRMADLKVRQYEEMKTLAGEGIDLMKKIGG